ncbi:hypothetical protein ABID22_003051 [Pontibacter aydingkolensis]|uniref:Uncharacterized protein n=1 Tax=Pontibacter aydingkolensis TaxID=1911536 RepID=A0ABS7CY17_9BACT|nr:hypothetical protein [Pontibacter aydingkolensis]MBW7468688.1 hypothetical protein [Pontibacter aydingkolensis]
MLITKEKFLTETYLEVAERLDDTLVQKRGNTQRQSIHKKRRNSLKEGGKAAFNSSEKKVTANAPLHVPDLNEVSYSDFILYNYGQVYQRQYSQVKSDKPKQV